MEKQLFLANIDHLYKMLSFIRNFCQSKNVNSKVLDLIVLATEEALVNIIHYSYPDQEGCIEIACRETTNKKGIRIDILDHGVAYDPIVHCPIKIGELPPLPSIENSKQGGYGIFIFTSIMDSVEYTRNKNSNLLSLIKYY